MAMSERDAKVLAATDMADRLREQFQAMPAYVFRKKGRDILVIMGVDADIARIAINEILDDEPGSVYIEKITAASDDHLDEGEDGEDR